MRWMFLCLGVLTVVAWPQESGTELSQWQPCAGEKAPPDWQAKGELLSRIDVDGRKLLAASGDGQQSAYWRSGDVPLTGGAAYRFQFKSRAKGSGTLISGLDRVNHDFRATADWSTFSFIFRAPDEPGKTLRVGHWHLNGQVLFDQPELFAVRPVHASWDGISLGDGERLGNGEYVDLHNFEWDGTTVHRTLHKQNAYFNTNRWVFSGKDEIIYLYAFPFAMRQAVLAINANHHAGGALVLSASLDGAKWTQLAEITKLSSVETPLTGEFSNAREIYIRLQAQGSGAYVQVNQYSFRAQVDYAGTPRTGQTLLVEERVTSPGLEARWEPSARGCRVRWLNQSGGSLKLKTATARENQWIEDGLELELAGNGSAEREIDLAALPAGRHTVGVRAQQGEKTVYEARLAVSRTVIEEAGYGALLKAAHPDLAVWTCEAGWKVGRSRPTPSGNPVEKIAIAAARGEYEAAQLVLAARADGLVLEEVAVSDLRTDKEGRIPASEIALFEVATVTVAQPSDCVGKPGEYPDPLPPLKTPLALPSGQNQALWIRVHVAAQLPAGDYDGKISVKTNRGQFEVPLQVHVYEFDLPTQPTLRSGFGLSASLIKRYHQLKTPEQEREVYELYLREFMAHRIAPYSFFDYDHIQVRFDGEGANKKVNVDFAGFDKAAGTYLSATGFNAFLLPVQGLGSGTFFERKLGEFGGFKVGTEDYERLLGDYLRQLENHLKEKGWLDKAYIYWFDEPAQRDFPFVVEGMQRLRKYAPSLRRMLTKQPEPELIGNVDLWCGLTNEWSAAAVAERRKAGEECWWYICTGPKAPYVGLFIEHPGVELRLWGWQSWQYGLQGLLIWQTNYWTSGTAFPKSLQNPWVDAMSYVSGYGTPEGTKSSWGNGDGRFFYPPRRDPNQPQAPAIQPPVTSIRLESLRDGIEDFEYFVLLRKEIDRLGKALDGDLRKRAEALLLVPPDISRDLTHFATDPRPLLQRRHEIALMIEALRRIK